MCGRITQKSNPHVLGLKITTLIEPLPDGAPPTPRYNGAPGQQHWVIRQHPETGARHLDRLWWGLIPYWTKEPSPKLKPINATAERVASAPMFRAAYAKRRCLLPVDNFFEWMAAKGKGPKQPYAIAMKSGEPFALAAIWESWRHPETGEIFRSFCVITTKANDLLAVIHDRMPVILDPEQLRPLAVAAGARPARPAGALSGRADDDVAHLHARQQARQRRCRHPRARDRRRWAARRCQAAAGNAPRGQRLSTLEGQSRRTVTWRTRLTAHPPRAGRKPAPPLWQPRGWCRAPRRPRSS